ncbi:unnamed protein product [Paramecium sonneborni]|uniref:RING-type domain-containing protein n=1 Tax=Paramecium sonneborni TaxID=65129 RepID=A0A8S1LUM5_9CILI|nr:unnamed protein product [Paramecium sonneborni]
MIISKSFAHSIKDFRNQNIILGCLSLIGLVSSCVTFVLLKNTLYQLIFLSELIIANFLMLVVFINQYKITKDTQYVLSMCFLINESERTNENWNLSLENMINLRSLQNVSYSQLFYTRIKIAFHNNCCESKDIFYFIFSLGVVIQLFFEQSFHSEINIIIMSILCFTTFWELFFVTLGIIIEMPRRIKQYYKMKALHRRVSQIQFQIVQRQSQIMENNQEALFLNLLQNGQPVLSILENNEPQLNQRLEVLPQHANINSIQEQIQCQICFEELEPTGNIQQLSCHPTHIFHLECISNWFQKKFQEDLVPSCPICRAPQNS